MPDRQRRRIRVDPLLDQLAYRCPEGCPRDRTCCVGLAVEVSRREVRVIDSLMDELARLRPALRTDGGYENVFVEDGRGMMIEPRDEAGTCPFHMRRGDRALCSIHHLALQTERLVPTVKPGACRQWPLVLVPAGGGIRISVHKAAERIGCVAPLAELPGHPTVREAFESEIAELKQRHR
jgi:hypothetical protein